MHLSTLSAWLDWIPSIHTAEIALGLERVKQVAERLDILSPAAPVILVGGTNGKGSTVAGLEAIYLAAGYQVGAFTSPFIFTYQEQVRINNELASEEAFCEAFEKINRARCDIPLTLFEFGTLAALLIFKKYPLDIYILEVGLGGRLDAVNILEPDVSIVTSISLDHQAWLGNTREAIAFEKAGIFRKGKPGICGDPHPPHTFKKIIQERGVNAYFQGQTFKYSVHENDFSWQTANLTYDHLPFNGLKLQNMSTVLMAITLLQSQLPVSEKDIIQGLKQTTLKGRIEVIAGEVTEIHDVSHNPEAVRELAHYLNRTPCRGKTLAVFAMLADKDIRECLRLIHPFIDEWFIAPLQNKRGATLEILKHCFDDNHLLNRHEFSNLKAAYLTAKEKAHAGDRIILFGSFHTLQEALS